MWLSNPKKQILIKVDCFRSVYVFGAYVSARSAARDILLMTNWWIWCAQFFLSVLMCSWYFFVLNHSFIIIIMMIIKKNWRTFFQLLSMTLKRKTDLETALIAYDISVTSGFSKQQFHISRGSPNSKQCVSLKVAPNSLHFESWSAQKLSYLIFLTFLAIFDIDSRLLYFETIINIVMAAKIYQSFQNRKLCSINWVTLLKILVVKWAICYNWFCQLPCAFSLANP